MKKIYSTAIGLIVVSISFGQSNTVGSGGEASGTGGTISYSVGQIDYNNSTGSNGSINEGIQQPYELFEFIGLDEHSLITTALYPNPTNEFVIISIPEFQSELAYTLNDERGRLIYQGLINSEETQLDMRTLSSGNYHLIISKATTQLESIKIFKY